MKFKLLNGVHFEAGKKYEKGKVVESEHNLVELFPLKFQLIEAPASASASHKSWEDEDEEKPKQPPLRTAARTMRDK